MNETKHKRYMTDVINKYKIHNSDESILYPVLSISRSSKGKHGMNGPDELFRIFPGYFRVWASGRCMFCTFRTRAGFLQHLGNEINIPFDQPCPSHQLASFLTVQSSQVVGTTSSYRLIDWWPNLGKEFLNQWILPICIPVWPLDTSITTPFRDHIPNLGEIGE